MVQNGEFAIIDRFFTHETFGAWRSKGVGDDCAIIDTGAGRLSVTCDMMAVGTHFLPSANPEDVGYKALAVNLSDLAASGAVPRAFFLAIGLPERNDAWLSGFTEGMMALAQQAGCALLGGDTTRTAKVGDVHAPITIAITAMGDLPLQMGLTRGGAREGDDVWVSGDVGGAYAALMHRQGQWTLPAEDFPAAALRMDRPEPRNALGTALLSVATACADISDGLSQDLGHILDRSGVAAQIVWDAVPAHHALRHLPRGRQFEAALSGGDDYELIFTAPADKRGLVEQAAISSLTKVTRIGRIVKKEAENERLVVHTTEGERLRLAANGFDHFA